MTHTITIREYLVARRRRLAAEEWETARGRGVYGDTALAWGVVLFFAAWLLRAFGVL